MRAAPDAADVARFHADLTALLPEVNAGGRVALAISGGPDSMAMLALAEAALGGRIVAATIDHGLRESAAAEAEMVATLCRDMGVPHVTLMPGDPIKGASIQARAREARYDLLGGWAAEHDAIALLTAHHCDDQAETFLMRAARGSGISGLAAVRPRTDLGGIALVRPLLQWRRAELRAIVRRSGMPFVDDPSNRDPRHDRTRFRRLLEENEWLDPPQLARAAAYVAAADADIRRLHDWLWAAHALPAPDGEVRIDVAEFPRELRRRVAREAIGLVRAAHAITRPAFSDARNVEQLLDALEHGKRSTVAGIIASADGAIWRFRKAPPRRSH